VDGRRKSTYAVKYVRMLDLLVAARRDAGLTQAQVAGMLHKPQSYVSKIESGERRLDVAELIEFLRALGQDEMAFFRSVLGSRGRGTVDRER
jgi:transcriptional regulator with XRE-family HTH domain